MSWMSLIRKFLSRFASWTYLLYAGAASFLTGFKGFAYAHLLTELQFAQVNYYLLVLGLGVLATGAGVIVRCHAELPMIVNDERRLVAFVGNVRGVGFLFWLLIGLVAVIYAIIVGSPVIILLLTLAQVMIFFLFTVDLLVIKSRKLFVEYSQKMFLRNLMIAAAGLAAAFIMRDALIAIMAEVGMSLLLYRKATFNFIRNLAWPDRVFLTACFAFVPVTLLGAVLQYVERVLAAYLMGPSDFSAFSYMSLVIMVALSVQQLINTRIITLLPEICKRDAKAGFRYVSKVAVVLTAFLCPALGVALWLLQSPWFSAEWVSVSLLSSALFLACSLLRAADFFSSYLIVMGRKVTLIWVQIYSLGLFSLLGIAYYMGGAGSGLEVFMSLMSAGFLLSLIVLVAAAWRVSRVQSVV